MGRGVVEGGVVEHGASICDCRVATIFSNALSFSCTEASFEDPSLPEPPGLVLSESRFLQEEFDESAGEGSLDESISTG